MAPKAPGAISETSVTIAVCGNPNSGKTSIFNAITGLNQKVANYPGVTVERVIGTFSLRDNPSSYTLIDIPGAYSLSPFSPDEQIAVDTVADTGSNAPSAIICVVDATQLERGLYIVLQLLQFGKPIVIALTMMDMVAAAGMSVDIDKLSRELGGIPVVPVVAPQGKGIEILKRRAAALIGTPQSGLTTIFPPAIENCLSELTAVTKSQFSRGYLQRLLFDTSGVSERRFVADNPEAAECLSRCRQKLVAEYGELSAAETVPITHIASRIASDVTTQRESPEKTTTEKIDRWLLHPVLGPIILLVVMAFMFQLIFSWATPFMEGIDSAIGLASEAVSATIPEGALRSLVDDGIFGGVGAVLVFIPQIVLLFTIISILEDSGYITRAAFLVDRLFRFCGLSGKSFIPMLSSFACAVPGIMAARTIENKSQRLMTILVAPLMTCSARLPVYTIMVAAFVPMTSYGPFNLQGLTMMSLYILGIVMAVIVSLIFKSTIFRSQSSTLMMEMPSYRMPTLKSVVVRVVNRVKAFILRAGTVILAIAIVIWALSYFPHSESITADWTARIEQENRSYAAQAETITDASTRSTLESDHAAKVAALENAMAGEHVRNSLFGRMGRAIEPLFEPLGWDWRITMAAIASFPAREVVVAVLGTTFNLGDESDNNASRLADKLRAARWESGHHEGKPLFSAAVALSIMVFFALCCQCGATLVTIRQETGSWWYSSLAFGYMTTLAWVMALLTYRAFHAMGM